jgi:hypothetical protein
MVNPAAALAVMLESWSVGSAVMPEQARADAIGADIGSMEFWEAHLQAIEYLKEIRLVLTTMDRLGEDPSPYYESLPAWYEAVFAFTTPWRQNTNGVREAVSRPNLQILRGLATHLRTMRYVPEPDELTLSSLVAALDGAQQLIESSPLPDPAKRYMMALVLEVSHAIEEYEVVGSLGLRTRVFELGGAMLSVSETDAVPEKERGTWKESARAVVVGMLSGGGAQLLIAAAAEAAKHIT